MAIGLDGAVALITGGAGLRQAADKRQIQLDIRTPLIARCQSGFPAGL